VAATRQYLATRLKDASNAGSPKTTGPVVVSPRTGKIDVRWSDRHGHDAGMQNTLGWCLWWLSGRLALGAVCANKIVLIACIDKARRSQQRDSTCSVAHRSLPSKRSRTSSRPSCKRCCTCSAEDDDEPRWRLPHEEEQKRNGR
jgi:hypothetical protein